MRRVSFEFFRDRALRIWRAREAAAAWVRPGDGRPPAPDVASLLLHALETHGPGAGPLECADEWLAHLDCHWHEYGIALENLRLGIGPPTSGTFNNDFYGECTGGAPRADLWGLLHAADPAMAASRASSDAQIEHCGAGLDLAAFLAAAVAEAFSAGDLGECLRAASRALPPGSRAAACVERARSVASAHHRDWRRSWSAIVADWGHPEPTDAMLNLSALVLALESGGLDWDRTLEVAALTGGDPHWKLVACASILAALGAEVGLPPRGRSRPARCAPGSALRDLEPLRSEEAFAGIVCRLAVACARADQVELAGAPYLPPPGPHVSPPVRLRARYEGEPVLAPGEQRAVFLERISGAEDIPGELVISSAERLKAEALGGVLVPSRIAARVVNVTLEDPTGLPGAVRAEVRASGRTVAEARFGFRRAARYVAFGPFENADGRGLERPYLNEAGLSERGVPSRGGVPERVLRANGDLVDVDGAFGARGPRVSYLVRVVHSPRERDVSLRVGCSDGIRLWLNGKRLLADHAHRCATPADYVVRARLRKGANKIVVKLARCGESSVFRLRITERGSEEALTDLWDPF